MKQLEKLLLMPDYFRALAKEWLNILFGETLVGIGFLVWWSLGAPTNHALVVVFVIAMFVAGYYAWRSEHIRLVPRLKIIESQLQDTPVTRQIEWARGKVHEEIVDHRTFVQLLPKCTTEATVYETLAYLQRVEKFVGGRWLDAGLDINLILKSEKVNHPGSEHPINIFFISHNARLINPWLWQGDIPTPKLATIFKLNTEGITVFRFYVQITYSDRINGHFVSIAKPIRICLEVSFENDPIHPRLEFKERVDS